MHISKKIALFSLALTISCGDISQLSNVQNSAESSLTLVDILSKEHWEVAGDSNWYEGQEFDDFCISWNFTHPERWDLSKLGYFLLVVDKKESIERSTYISDCSETTGAISLFFHENAVAKRHKVAQVFRVSPQVSGSKSPTPAIRPTTIPSTTIAQTAIQSPSTPVETPTPTPIATATPRPATGTFVIKMKVGNTNTYIKTYTYNNIWINDSLSYLGTTHTSKLLKSGSTYTWDLTQTNSNCQSDGTNCTAYCYSTIATGDANLIVGKRYIDARYWGLTTCGEYSDLVD
jgi:hypothetical protein